MSGYFSHLLAQARDDRGSVSPESASTVGSRAPAELAVPAVAPSEADAVVARVPQPLHVVLEREQRRVRRTEPPPERVLTEPIDVADAVPVRATHQDAAARTVDETGRTRIAVARDADDDFRLVPDDAGTRAAADRPPRTTRAHSVSVQRAAVARRDSMSATNAGAPEPTEVHVTIGRIEVTAVHMPATPNPKPADRARAMSLDEYLAQRPRGGA